MKGYMCHLWLTVLQRLFVILIYTFRIFLYVIDDNKTTDQYQYTKQMFRYQHVNRDPYSWLFEIVLIKDD